MVGVTPDEVLARAVERGDPPAASACAFVGGACVYEAAFGAQPRSVFDVASVTKVVATTSVIAALVAEGALGLDDPVATHVPAFARHGKDRVTIRELLGHRSGLPAWGPLFLAGDVMEGVFDAKLERPGRRVYSDLGFLALGAMVEAITGDLAEACRIRVWEPLGIADLGYAGPWLEGRHVLPTGTTRPREPAPGQESLYTVPPQPRAPDPGQVDDDNAFALGGVAGHAGVFATARAVAEMGEAWRTGAIGSAEFLSIDPADGGPPRGLGFDVPTGPRSSFGALLGRGRAFGHLGFTGCSLWIDLDRAVTVALLTNRTFPGRHHVEGIRALRPAFHDALARAS